MTWTKTLVMCAKIKLIAQSCYPRRLEYATDLLKQPQSGAPQQTANDPRPPQQARAARCLPVDIEDPVQQRVCFDLRVHHRRFPARPSCQDIDIESVVDESGDLI